MLQLFVFFQIQALSLVVVAVLLRDSFKKSVADICEINSTRMDGSYSKRRNAIELESIKHATYSIWSGLATFFLLISVFELLVVGICFGIWGLGPAQVSGDAPNNALEDFAILTHTKLWQWPMMVGFGVLTIVILFPYVRYLVGSARQQYRWRANSRAQQYYQMQFCNEAVPPRDETRKRNEHPVPLS